MTDDNIRARSSAPEDREGEAVAVEDGFFLKDDGSHLMWMREGAVSFWVPAPDENTHPAAPSADKLRSIIYAATDAVLPPACDTTGNGTQARAAMQVEIADGVIAALKAEAKS